MYDKIVSTIEGFEEGLILDERKKVLAELVDYVVRRVKDKKKVNLNFICTHNSRRSHMSQIWAQVMSVYFDISDVNSYSGGTESTAMFPVVGAMLESQGFHISKLADQTNPVYIIKYDEVSHPMIAFSKKYDDVFNPSKEYGAIMTCASADQGCPVVLGADARMPIRYEDPKASDGTPQQKETYLARSIQIGTEMKWVFQYVKEKLNQ